MRLLAAPLLAAAAVARAAGCSSEETASVDQPTHEGVPWVLTSGIDIEGWEEKPPSTRFGPRRMGGTTGCNEYRAPFTVDGSALTLGPVAQTLIGCPSPASDVESTFLASLDRVAGWRIEGGELELLDSDHKEILRFRAVSPVGSWVVTGVLQGDAIVTPLAGTDLTAEFSDEDELRGSAGCNGYRATFSYRADHWGDRGKVAIAAPAATKMLCNEPEGVMDQETAYLEALQSATRYRFVGSTLRLSRSDGTLLLTFAHAP